MERIIFISVLLTAVFSVSAGVLRQYHFVNSSKTWTDAQSYCRAHFTALATADNRDLQEIMNSVKNQTDYVWIGLQNTSGSEWKWSLGDPAFFIQHDSQFGNWDNRNENSDKNCVYMKKNGRWQDESCDASFSFICYNDSSKQFILIKDTNNNPEIKTWHEAQRYCREKHTDLTSVRNLENNQKIQDLISQTRDEKAWIGLFKDQNQTCTSVSVRDGHKSWKNESCHENNAFVCHEDQLVLIRQDLTWTEALQHCRRKQMELVSVESEKIQDDVMNVIRSASTSGVWMGLTHSCVLGLWFWVSGELMCYQNWAPGNGTGPEDCSNRQTHHVIRRFRLQVQLIETNIHSVEFHFALMLYFSLRNMKQHH